jgi:hypothetical protein
MVSHEGIIEEREKFYVWHSSRSEKPTPLQVFSAKHVQLQQLHCGSAQKKVEQSTSRGAPPTPVLWSWKKLPTTASVK